MPSISRIHARQILDSRGNPTLEADVYLADGSMGRAAVPSGASTGAHEALELRDGDATKYHGQGVLKAVANVGKIAEAVTKAGELDQESLDKMMIELDGTEMKSNLGANAILGVSLAFAWAVAASQKRPLFRYIGELYGNSNFIMPRPMFNIMNGGKHAGWATDIQEYMVLPLKAEGDWETQMRMGSEVFQSLEKVLKANKLSTNVGNEGGFAPAVSSNQQALDFIVQAIEKAGYKLGEDIACGFDAAATEFYNAETGMYDLRRDKVSFTSDQMVQWAKELKEKYNVISYEDFLSEDDWAGWTKLTAELGGTQVVGDDLLVTNVKRVEKAMAEKSANALLVKVNQIGSLTEALAAMKLAESAGWKNVVSHRSGETEDVTIAHIVVGTGAGQIKTGAPSRGERTAKYNELVRISEQL